MKIQLDTDQKIIRLDEPTNLGDLFSFLEKILPNGMWKSFKLEITNNFLQPTFPNPTIIQPWPTPVFPWWRDTIIYSTQELNPGIYNIE